MKVLEKFSCYDTHALQGKYSELHLLLMFVKNKQMMYGAEDQPPAEI